jgi:hypothetical protein
MYFTLKIKNKNEIYLKLKPVGCPPTACRIGFLLLAAVITGPCGYGK